MSDLSTANGAAQYEIRLQGHLDHRWGGWFDGLTLTNNADGTSVIHGLVVDQSALHGLLRQVRDVGLALISVTRIESTEPAGTPPSTPGRTT